MSNAVFEIHALAYGGDAVGRLDSGKVCFVPGALPGETVEAELVQEKSAFARARLLRIIHASPERIEPRCPRFLRPGAKGDCPGCAYQHASYALELEWKQRQLTDFLTRSHLIDPAAVSAPFASPERFGCRNKIKLRQTEGVYGYCGRDNETLVAIDSCPLAAAEINRFLAGSPEISAPVFTLRFTPHDGVVLLPGGKAPAHRDWLTETLPGFGDFKCPADGFFQTNIPVASELTRRVVEILQRSGTEKLVELYCGVGIFSIAAATALPKLNAIGIEWEKSAVLAARFNAQKHGVVGRCRFFAGDAGKALRARQADAALCGAVFLLDPPRTGLAPEVIREVAAAGPEKILYVSCAPDTLRRDLEKFRDVSWRAVSASLLDMFPATAHFETLVELEKR